MSTPSSFSSCWADLPLDLMTTITDRLNITSTTRLSAVCTSWASTIRRYSSLPPYRIDRPIPWLLRSAHQNPEPDCSNTHTPISTNFTFYDISTATSYSVPIPLLQGQRWLGSYKGWLVTADQTNKLRVIKPLTGACISLPSLPSFGTEEELPKKVVLSHNIDSIDEISAACCLTREGRLLMAKVGDEKWTYLSFKSYEDIIFYQGKVYASSWHGLYCCDPQFPFDNKYVMDVYYSTPWRSWKSYLLESKGELFMLQVNRNLNEIILYKINLETSTVR